MTVDESGGVLELERELERSTLRRLELIRSTAIGEGALGTPTLDRAIDETRAIVARLEAST